jgi:hypothetical protein
MRSTWAIGIIENGAFVPLTFGSKAWCKRYLERCGGSVRFAMERVK